MGTHEKRKTGRWGKKLLIPVVVLAAGVILVFSFLNRNLFDLIGEQNALRRADQLYEMGYCELALEEYLAIESYAAVYDRIEELKAQADARRKQESGEEKVTVAKVENSSVAYTWYIKDPGSTEWVRSEVTSAEYSCRMTAEKSGRQVYCVITDSAGNEIVSEITTLTYEETD